MIVVVVGAGMGGLTAAKAVAPHFERVIVFDRDALPDVDMLAAAVDEAFEELRATVHTEDGG